MYYKEHETQQIKEQRQQTQEDIKRQRCENRRKIEDLKLAKEVGLDYDDIKDL